MSRFLCLFALLALSLGACTTTQDTDGDLLTDSFEATIGTNPEIDDSDGDGFLDGVEYLSYFDPMDEDDHPIEGNYPRGPIPAEIDNDGWDEGDISNNWTHEDRHGDIVDLHDFYGQVILVDVGSEWCGPCQNAAPIAQDEYELCICMKKAIDKVEAKQTMNKNRQNRQAKEKQKTCK